MSPYTPKKINRLVNKSRKTGGFERISRVWQDVFSPRIKRQETSIASPERSRAGYFVRGSLLLSIIVLLLVGVVWLSYYLLAGSDIVRLTAVTVVGNRVLADHDILRASGLVHRTCLLGFDVEAAETRITELDWVDRVDIVVAWPSRVVINIREHKPFALINLRDGPGRQLHYVDYQGNVFIRVAVGYDLDFPVISGEIDSSVTGDAGDKKIGKDSAGHQALKLLRLAARGNAVLPGLAVSEVSVDPEYGLILFLTEHPFPIYMGKDNIRSQYHRLIRVLGRLYRDGTVKTVKDIRMNYLQSKALVAMLDPVR